MRKFKFYYTLRQPNCFSVYFLVESRDEKLKKHSKNYLQDVSLDDIILHKK